MIHPFVIYKGKLISFTRYVAKEFLHRAEIVALAKAALARGEGYY